jgi:hypothetical protein
MVSKALTVRRGRALALPMAKAATAGAALVTEILDADAVQVLVDSQRLCEASKRHAVGDLDATKLLHARWLPDLASADSAYQSLLSVAQQWPSLTATEAGAMLSYLFTVMGKRKSDEAAAKLHACVDLFNPASNEIARALGLWKPVPRHPLVLALAIKQLMAQKTFEPSEAELREALSAVEEKLRAQRRWVFMWLQEFDRADALLFAQDRPAWDAAYGSFGSDVAGAMAAWLDDHEPRKDAKGNPVAESPRWKALNEIWDRKFDAEEKAAALVRL